MFALDSFKQELHTVLNPGKVILDESCKRFSICNEECVCMPVIYSELGTCRIYTKFVKHPVAGLTIGRVPNRGCTITFDIALGYPAVKKHFLVELSGFLRNLSVTFPGVPIVWRNHQRAIGMKVQGNFNLGMIDEEISHGCRLWLWKSWRASIVFSTLLWTRSLVVMGKFETIVSIQVHTLVLPSTVCHFRIDVSVLPDVFESTCFFVLIA